MRVALTYLFSCAACVAVGAVIGAGIGQFGRAADAESSAPAAGTARVPVLNRFTEPGAADEPGGERDRRSDDTRAQSNETGAESDDTDGRPGDIDARADEADARADEADALVAAAAIDPVAVMRAATRIEPYWRRRDTLERIASVWAERSPADALAWLEASRDTGDARRPLRVQIVETWAEDDPVGMLNFLSGPAGTDLSFTDQRAVGRAIAMIADADPYFLLTRADDWPLGPMRSRLRYAAIERIAERDPEFAEREMALAQSDTERAEWQLALDTIVVVATDRSD